MKKYNSENLKNIQSIVQEKTGARVTECKKPAGYKLRQTVLLAVGFLCFVTLCAFAYAEFSGLSGDEAGFAAVYQGGGRFEVIIFNDSDRELKLQDKVRVMQWSTGKEVEGNGGEVKMEVMPIAPHSCGIVSIDLAAGYDIGAMEENLPEGDSYYFVLTNNGFAFGQDWMCFFDFETQRTEDVERRLVTEMKEREKREEQKETAMEEPYGTGGLFFTEWVWPTVSQEVSAFYGEQENGAWLDHINIAGVSGDEVYAVADGVVLKAAFEGACGNVIVVDLGDGITVKYGYLEELKVSKGEEIKQGQVIAALGRSGMATGPNLLFAVTADGEAMDPLAAE